LEGYEERFEDVKKEKGGNKDICNAAARGFSIDAVIRKKSVTTQVAIIKLVAHLATQHVSMHVNIQTPNKPLLLR
jgi:hypothetical protein